MAKLTYMKPTFQFHQIPLATAAVSCSISAAFQEYTCPVTVPEWGMTIFTDTDCDMDNPDQVCYHVPTASYNVFGS